MAMPSGWGWPYWRARRSSNRLRRWAAVVPVDSARVALAERRRATTTLRTALQIAGLVLSRVVKAGRGMRRVLLGSIAVTVAERG